jgi:GAF domain-containing protein
MHQNDQAALQLVRSPLSEKSGLAFACDTILALAADQSLAEVLQACAQAFVDHLGVNIARIWSVSLTGRGFELQASAGQDGLVQGKYARETIGWLVQNIADECRAYATEDLPNDPWLNDSEWAITQGLIAFARYPLMCRVKLVGVSVVYSKQPISELAMQMLAMKAGSIALAIARSHSEAALDKVRG